MKRVHHSPEQIVKKLREVEAGLSLGKTLEELCKQLGIAESTYHRWRNQYGGIKADEVRRLRDLEKENVRLKRIVADLTLDNSILREVARGNF
jgi:transposase-like protein